jgi:GMP synthase-like glutamine amidotransferase
MVPKKHLMVIDPAVVKPAIESFNRIASVAPYPVTYHLPALYGTNSLNMFNKNVRGIIVLGSAASVNDDNKWQQTISDIMIEASANCIPVLGLCYGHQLIGHAYGGKVGPLWSGEKKQGERIVLLKKSDMWGEPSSGPLLYSHQDGITEMPPDFEIIADSDLVSTDAIASKLEPVWGFQTHLEATQAFVDNHRLPVKDAKESFRFGHSLLDKFILSLK